MNSEAAAHGRRFVHSAVDREPDVLQRVLGVRTHAWVVTQLVQRVERCLIELPKPSSEVAEAGC